jgi:hypothetical protein
MPERPDRERVLELLRASAINHEYFFERAGAAWLDLLADAEYFRSPPPAERGGDWIRFPGWSESRYLVRVADQAPERVFKLAFELPETDNVRVHEDVLEIAARLPVPLAARLAKQQATWLQDYEGPLMSLPSAAGALMTVLAEGRKHGRAFGLASALLRIFPAPAPASSRGRAISLLNDWEYRELVKQVWPSLMAAAPTTAFRFLCDRLRDVITISSEQTSGFDPTEIWRSAIESHAQNVGHGLLDVLVDAVRDTAVVHAATPAGLTEILEALGHYDGSLFRRLELYVIAQRGDVEQAAAAVLDPALSSATGVWHEYGELLHNRFGDLPPADRDAVLALIAAGPGSDPSDPEREQRAQWWRLRRYEMIADRLDSDALAHYRELRAELGEPDHPTFLRYSTSWSGPTSPLGATQLQAMQPDELARTLREWTAPAEPMQPTPEGLGRELTTAVASDPARFAAGARALIGVPATYARAYLSGLTQAVKAGAPIAWDPTLALAEWVLEQPRSATNRTAGFDEDPHWGWARKRVADLLAQGFVAGPAELPATEDTRAWTMLSTLAEDPDPVAGSEESFEDALTVSINTTRGEALHTVVRYALWRERELRAHDAFEGFASLPHVSALLERHLDPAIDPSPSMRAVPGNWFPQFVRMDPAWAASIADRVFPRAPEQQRYFDAAWSAYINHSPAYTNVYAVLRDAYLHAVALLSSDANEDAALELGDHIVRFVVAGRVGLEPDDLFASYWAAASPELQRRVLEQVGWSLKQTTEPLTEIARRRFSAMWEWVFADAQATGATRPLAGFGGWLAAEQLDGHWLLAQARAVLALGVPLHPAFTVYTALPRLAGTDARGAVELLRLTIKTNDEPWAMSGSETEIGETLSIGLHDADAGTRASTREVGDLLLARGFTSFRSLLED